MRNVAIIGAGIAGLMTAHHLLKSGYQVTLYSDRTPEQWLNESRPTGAAGRFAPALAYERELGLNHWDKEAPKLEGVHLVFSLTPTVPFIMLTGRVEEPGAAIDVRLQSARWMHDLVERGGQLCIENVDVARLDAIAAEHDLTIVATGKADLSRLFERNEQRSVYTAPQRNLAMVIVKNMGSHAPIPFTPVKFSFIGEYGELFWLPYYHKTLGATWVLLFEAKKDTPMDRFNGLKTGAEVVARAKEVIKDLFPWDYHQVKDAELADENGWLTGALTPTVRNPVGKLPSGRVVTGVGDTLMTLDPIGGQGANNGYRMARNLVESIIARGQRDFDAAWMNDTFEAFFKKSGELTNTFNNLLLEPISDAGRQLLIAQYGSNGQPGNTSAGQKIANAFTENFADPGRLTPLFLSTEGTHRFIGEMSGSHWLIPEAGGFLRIARDQIRQKLGMKPVVGYWQNA